MADNERLQSQITKIHLDNRDYCSRKELPLKNHHYALVRGLQDFFINH